MTFDWFTLLAQIFNFALLLVLLRVFLYRPLLATMAEREALATSALTEARRLQAEAQQEREALAAQRAREDAGRAARRAELSEELERLRRERTLAVSRETEALREAAIEALDREVGATLGRLRTDVAGIVLDEVRETLAWLSGHDLEARAVERFLRRLHELPETERRELAEAAGSDVRFQTAHTLDGGTRDEVVRAVSEVLGASEVSFETDERLVLGAVLIAGGVRVDGSASARLEALRERFARVLADLRTTDREPIS